MHTGTESDSGSSTVVVQSGSTRAQRHKSVKVIAKWKEGIDGAESPNNKVQALTTMKVQVLTTYRCKCANVCIAGGVVHVYVSFSLDLQLSGLLNISMKANCDLNLFVYMYVFCTVVHMTVAAFTS